MSVHFRNLCNPRQIIGGEHDFNGSGFFVLTVDGQSIADRTASFIDAHMRAGGMPVYERRDIPR